MDKLSAYLHNVLGTLICLFIIRIFIVYLRIHKKKKTISRSKLSSKLMIVLGSGGHTFEMLHIIRNIREKIRPRIYVIADTDLLSEQKVKDFEESKKSSVYPDLFVIEKIHRSREVGQSWFTSVFTTLRACIDAFHLVFKHMPDAVLCNGPGTCVPLCLAAVFVHILGVKQITIIYVESICRVKTLSLTGKILYYIADHFYVHWPELKENYPLVQYIGKLL